MGIFLILFLLVAQTQGTQPGTSSVCVRGSSRNKALFLNTIISFDIVYLLLFFEGEGEICEADVECSSGGVCTKDACADVTQSIGKPVFVRSRHSSISM